jgi:WD40 repeat protein
MSPTQGTRPSEIKVFDVASGKEVLALQGHVGPAFAVAFRPDGKQLATCAMDQTVRLWDARTGKEVRVLRLEFPAMGLAYSPDGMRLAAAVKHDLRVWEVETGKQGLGVKGHTGVALSVAWSPDGRLLATGGSDRLVQLWEPATGKVLFSLRGHTGTTVHSLAFSPDGKRLLSAAADRTARMWSTATGQEVLPLHHPGRVHAVAFSPDGRLVATGSDSVVSIARNLP